MAFEDNGSGAGEWTQAAAPEDLMRSLLGWVAQETDDATIGTCWDADRLDLMRVGRRPDPALLMTEAARDPEVIDRAIRRSLE